MIKYRYHVPVSTEPANVNRVQVVYDRYDYETVHGSIVTVPKHLGDVWFRDNCHKRVGGFVYGRPGHFRIGRSHRSISKKQWRRERDWPRTLCRAGREVHHAHWHNGDRWRPWGDFRGGFKEFIDVDAFSRMRTMYRRGRK